MDDKVISCGLNIRVGFLKNNQKSLAAFDYKHPPVGLTSRPEGVCVYTISPPAMAMPKLRNVLAEKMGLAQEHRCVQLCRGKGALKRNSGVKGLFPNIRQRHGMWRAYKKPRKKLIAACLS